MNFTTIALILLPFVTAFIGWLTNWCAIKMLFHPRRAMGPHPRLSWQGLIPRRQAELSTQAAEIIEREILSHHIVSREIRKLDLTPYLDRAASGLVRERLAPKLKQLPLVGSFINEENIRKLEQSTQTEVRSEGADLVEKIAQDFEGKFDVKAIVEERIRSFDLDKLESIVMEVARREFKTIDLIGAALGFLIGVLQLAALFATGSLQF